jgi:chemotaxis protein CheX
MKAEIINPFIKAAVEVLQTMAFVQCRAGKPYLKKDASANGDVSSVIGLTGVPNGTIAISFDESSILKIVSNMFGEELTQVDEEVADAVGELFNMVSGQARRQLEEIGYCFEASIPSVFMGKNHTITHITDGPKIALPFNTETGAFTIEVCFERDEGLN